MWGATYPRGSSGTGEDSSLHRRIVQEPEEASDAGGDIGLNDAQGQESR